MGVKLKKKKKSPHWLVAWHTASSLAKPLHGIAASVSILFCQAACRGLTMTVAPSFKCMYLYVISPTTFVIKFPQPLRAFPLRATSIRSKELPKPCYLGFKLTNPVLSQELQSIPSMNSHKGMWSRSWPPSLPTLCVDFLLLLLKLYHLYLPGLTSNQFLYFNFYCGLLLRCSSSSGTVCST